MTIQEALADNVDQDQTAQHMQSDLLYKLSIFILDYNKTISSSCNGNAFLSNEKLIYLVVKEFMYIYDTPYKVKEIHCVAV